MDKSRSKIASGISIFETLYEITRIRIMRIPTVLNMCEKKEKCIV